MRITIAQNNRVENKIMNQRPLLNFTFSELKTFFKNVKAEPFLASQIFDWIYKKYKLEFPEMSNIAVFNQKKLIEYFQIISVKNIKKIESNNKLAIKYIFELNDGNFIESVILKEKDYYTICVSSQVGCALKCVFCKTGYLGFKRNLEVSEILMQILSALKDGYKISHIVFMGMGEPLLNYENVMKSIEIITDPNALNISKRKITISTSGIIDGLKKIIADDKKINLALSIGATNPQKRKLLMPVENRNQLHEVIRLLKEFTQQCNRQLTLEYTLIKDKNDSKTDLEELINLAKYLRAKVNLIELNPITEFNFNPLNKGEILNIKNFLIKNGINTTIRFRKGLDINAACGQLGSPANQV
ncbi:MAG: 23S rRNA (adenine(2503)-C(2))-methyltransferase RlmN [Candidatus Margulisiibacteriota bacterium]|jgi:23S rRNA (adenine2503-C2)-methyltransferase